MQNKAQITAAYFAAVFCTSALASIFSTQFVIAALQDVGVLIPFETRLSMTFHDLAIFETLLLVTAACFFVGFIVATTCVKHIGGARYIWFVLAGASALVSTLLLMTWHFQLTPIAGARTLPGLTFQALAGAAGGLLFSRLTHPK